MRSNSWLSDRIGLACKGRFCIRIHGVGRAKHTGAGELTVAFRGNDSAPPTEDGKKQPRRLFKPSLISAEEKLKSFVVELRVPRVRCCWGCSRSREMHATGFHLSQAQADGYFACPNCTPGTMAGLCLKFSVPMAESLNVGIAAAAAV
ncbi:hypothetical protein MPH_09342 [Macrophomina phaseolina MS6]|uniref:Uncharacterized protein n=1 Tax=Macrophomina phaseolina (strain MS6) TaxID=1126212 RepID=K2S9F5_MACPH|nr:hypothetical protein MPH_09342 [Macrophomina phaseolina MS6]